MQKQPGSGGAWPSASLAAYHLDEEIPADFLRSEISQLLDPADSFS